ncbi:MAG: (d)CMP kinase [Saccharofermentanales bacterium]|jgi:cytidylate kinase
MTRAIALDGLSGAGKSTIAKALANTLGINYLDTGAMYRALAYAAKQEKIPLDDEDLVAPWLGHSGLELVLAQTGQKTLLHGVDVSSQIRSPEMSRLSSAISALPSVRHYCVEMQRQLADQQMPLVLDGRDIGSYVLPRADFKFYLEATAVERARRRWQQMQDGSQGSETQSYDQVLAEIIKRDLNDSSRELAPAIAAPDAIVIDTTELSAAEVLQRILQLMRVRTAENPVLGDFWQQHLVLDPVFDTENQG